MTDTDSTQAPVKEGEILAGKYRVESVLGVGGMGVVVAATHIALGQRVALKFLLPDALRSPQALERFAREARAAARLRSDHVARVLDVGTLANGAPYMVMEYLDGMDLGALVHERGALRIEDAVEFVLQACDAVSEAHSVGIVHRDLKPRNLFLTKKTSGAPYVKVLDFGISKLTTITGQDHSLTKTTDVMGSPNYMAPEQIRSSRDVDERTDVWALGVILYELVTGRVPFLADTVPQLCALVLEQQPTPLEELRPETPPELRHVIARCLQKDPAARFGSVTELASALAQLVAQPAIASTVRWSSDAPPQGDGKAGSSARVIVSGGTSVTWGDTVLGRDGKKAGRARVAAMALGGVCVVSAIAFALTRWNATEKSAPAANPSTIATTIESPASATATTVTATAATANTTATTDARPAAGLALAADASPSAPTAQPSHAPVPPPSPSASAKPSSAPSHASPPPTPSGGADLLPRERK